MADGAESESRYFPRYYRVRDGLDLALMMEEQGEPLWEHVIVDVSRDGLGVRTTQPVVPGEHITAEVGPHTIQFVIAYCTADLVHQNEFRVGLQRVGSHHNVLALFEQLDLLAEETSG